MQTATSGIGRRIAKAASLFSARTRRQMARVQRFEEEEARLARAEQERQARREAAEAARIRRGIRKRLPLARRGLDQLLAIGQSKEMEKILRHTEFLFYTASRRSGDYFAMDTKELREAIDEGTRHSAGDEDGVTSSAVLEIPHEEVNLTFHLDHLAIHVGLCQAGLGQIYDVFFEPQSNGDQQYRVVAFGEYTGRSDLLWSLDDLLDRVVGPKPVDMVQVRRYGQRVEEWDAEEVVGQLLVNCSRSRCLDGYMRRSLERFQKYSD